MTSNREAVASWYRQDHERLASAHVFSDRSTVFSYGRHFPMATLHERYVLTTYRRYSNSTAKHLHLVRAALRHVPTFDVYDPTATLHDQNVADLVRRYQGHVEQFRRARTRKAWLLEDLGRLRGHLQAYCQLFGLNQPMLLSPPEQERFDVELIGYRLLAA